METDAETAIAQKELSWARKQLKPRADNDEEDDGRGPVDPPMNSKEVECNRDCMVRKQLEKERAEANLNPAYDTANKENMHNVVTKGEQQGINQPRAADVVEAA